jgi:hypothetical protein
MHQHQFDAQILRRALDLGETVSGGRIDAGDELEVEQQVAAYYRRGRVSRAGDSG